MVLDRSYDDRVELIHISKNQVIVMFAGIESICIATGLWSFIVAENELRLLQHVSGRSYPLTHEDLITVNQPICDAIAGLFLDDNRYLGV